MNKYGEVYSVRVPSGIYIGSTLGGSSGRWTIHRRLLRNGQHHCQALQEAYNDGGISAFAFAVLEEGVPSELLIDRERTLTQQLGGLNALPGRVIPEQKREAIFVDIEKGVPYRVIATTHAVSLGAVARVKALSTGGGCRGNVDRAET